MPAASRAARAGAVALRPGAAVLLAAALLTAMPAGAAPTPAPAVAIPAPAPVGATAEQRRAAQSEAGELRDRIQSLKRDLNKAESDRSEARDALRASEAAISEANRQLHDLDTRQRETEAALAAANAEQARVEREIADQRERLARLARAEYTTGRISPWQLLLSGQNPNDSGRSLALLGYVGRAQRKAIDELEAAERQQAELAASQRQRIDELAAIRAEQETGRATLEREKLARSATLAQVSARLDEQRRQVGALERDAERLNGLIDKLGKIIADDERRERERIAAEKRRAEQAARDAAKEAARRELAEREAARKRAEADAARARSGTVQPAPGTGNRATASAGAGPSAPVGGASTPAGSAGAPSAGTPENVAPPAGAVARAAEPAAPPPPPPAPSIAMLPDGSAFEALRGRLAQPAAGEITGRFGRPRDNGQSTWKGLFIAAPTGAEVHAVARGRVVFADWLRGFGNIVIVDHGGQYLSIYAGNESIYKTAGQSVNAGDTIASVGATGGAERPGLYFELRHAGAAIDPSGWLR
ncbi:murein hydrolase activator EnvC family protein [Derxia lacustris]|uniref:murein hydrolase activator EnvC family protein n=1 Tax=Derxia lacustris TaxID=764842 RepID=UPI000A1777D7|nr:peptidoglycan DD-metalloendopeptidase family protein [Derxia lacustris]